MAKGDFDAAVKVFEQAGWVVDKSVLDKVPTHLRQEFKLAQSSDSATNPRGGIRFETKRDYIRIMQGNPYADQLYQRQDYVKIVSMGKCLVKMAILYYYNIQQKQKNLTFL